MNNGSELEEDTAASDFAVRAAVQFDPADEGRNEQHGSEAKITAHSMRFRPIEDDVRGRRMRLLANPTWQDLLSFLLSFGAVTLIIVLLILLGWDTLRQAITIDPIRAKGFW